MFFAPFCVINCLNIIKMLLEACRGRDWALSVVLNCKHEERETLINERRFAYLCMKVVWWLFDKLSVGHTALCVVRVHLVATVFGWKKTLFFYLFKLTPLYFHVQHFNMSEGSSLTSLLRNALVFEHMMCFLLLTLTCKGNTHTHTHTHTDTHTHSGNSLMLV